MPDKKNHQTPIDNEQDLAVSPDMIKVLKNADDEIDLRELWNVIWRGKWFVITITTLFALVSVFYALNQPNIYKSEALLAPSQTEKQGGLSGLAGQFGGLASLAGVNLGGGGVDKTGLAVEIIKSREFFANFAGNHNILPDLMAVTDWDLSSNTVTYDEDIYLPDSAEWVRAVGLPRKPKPSMQEAKKVFDKLFDVNESKETGMIIVSVKHLSPYVAKQWTDWVIEDINLVMRNRDKKEAIKSITYLQSQIESTTIFEHKTLLYQLIEEQTKTLMFAEVRDEYVFKTIDPALVSELKFEPSRALITVVGTLIGGFLALLFLFVIQLSGKNISLMPTDWFTYKKWM